MGDRRSARCGARRFAAALVLAALAFPAAVLAQSVSIDAGASWQLGDATLDLDCATLDVAGALHAQDGEVGGIGDLDIAGQVTATTASLDVGGDWNNHGAFLAGIGTVRLGDRCDRAHASILGATGFSSLRIESARAKAYSFEAGRTQSIAVLLQLAGAAGQYLSIGSTQAGTRAGLALSTGGAQQIAWLSVADMEAPEGSAWLAPGLPEAFNAVDAGNNLRWFQAAPPAEAPTPIPAPALSAWALLALALALGVFGARRFRLR